MKSKYSLPVLALTGLLGCATSQIKDMDKYLNEPASLRDYRLINNKPRLEPGETKFIIQQEPKSLKYTEPINLNEVVLESPLQFNDTNAYMIIGEGVKLTKSVVLYENQQVTEERNFDWPVTEETKDNGQPPLELKISQEPICEIDGRSCLK
jgi:hypothetical protein